MQDLIRTNFPRFRWAKPLIIPASKILAAWMPRYLERPTASSPHWPKPALLGLVLLSGPLLLLLLAPDFIFYQSAQYAAAAWPLWAALWLWFTLKFTRDPQPGSWRVKAVPLRLALGTGAVVAGIIVLAPHGWVGTWTALFGHAIVTQGWIENAQHYEGARYKACDQSATLVYAQARHEGFCLEGRLPLPVRSSHPLPVQVTLRHSAVGYVVHSVEASAAAAAALPVSATGGARPAPAP
jgi:hypothetical protein